MIPHINLEPSAFMWSIHGLPTSGPPPADAAPAILAEDGSAILTEDGSALLREAENPVMTEGGSPMLTEDGDLIQNNQ